MDTQRFRRLVREDHGNGALAWVVVTSTFSVLVFQPSLIVAAVDRFSNLVHLLISQLEYVF